MRILVACEFSGTVREALRRAGHDAWSCDILDTDCPGQHINEDVRHVICGWDGMGWDGMVAHPPCTHLAVSGSRWFKDKQQEQAEALDFVRTLLGAPIERIALENPVSVISTRIRKPDQIIQPWQFGHPEAKATCLWLKNLPKLSPTNVLEPRKQWDNQTPSGQNRLGPSPDRWKKRSTTYSGIADAMATQWFVA
jgi:site-specific DNA-cytosine methylase